MQTRASKNPTADAAQAAASTDTADSQEPVQRVKNPAAVALGLLGASKGGHARAKKLSPDRRKKIAQKAALARWGKSK